MLLLFEVTICAWCFQIVYISGNSVDNEISRSITKDFPLIAAAVLVFIVTAVLGLSK